MQTHFPTRIDLIKFGWMTNSSTSRLVPLPDSISKNPNRSVCFVVRQIVRVPAMPEIVSRGSKRDHLLKNLYLTLV